MCTEDDDECDFVDTGPFCRHWSDSDCDVLCARCGHRCCQHGCGVDNESQCDVDDCDCEGWKESD